MIVLKDLVIKGNKEPINLSFNNGINEILHKDRYLYKFLRLKDQAIDSGELLINGVPFSSNQKDKSLFVLAINSQVFCLSICVITKQEEKDNVVKQIQDDLLKLRDLSIVTLNEQKEKIDKITETISKYELGYVLIDENNEVNQDHISLINASIDKYKEDITFIYLKEEGITEVKPNPVVVTNNVNEEKQEPKVIHEDLLANEDIYEFTVGAYSPSEAPKVIPNPKRKEHKEKEKKSTNKSNEWLALLKPTLKDNWISLLLFMLEIAFTVILSIVGPYLVSTEGATFASVIIIILLVFCVFASMFISSTIVSIIDKKEKDTILKFRILLVSLLTMSLVGIGIGYLLFIIFKNTNFLIKQEKWQDSFLILSIFISVIGLIVPFIAKYIHLLAKKIKKSLNNK